MSSVAAAAPAAASSSAANSNTNTSASSSSQSSILTPQQQQLAALEAEIKETKLEIKAAESALNACSPEDKEERARLGVEKQQLRDEKKRLDERLAEATKFLHGEWST